MKEKLFEELVASVREGGAILRGEQNPSRQFSIDETDIKRIRENYRLSQGQFATLLGISVSTLQNWEQGRRVPNGAASVLLQVAAKHPDAVWDVVKPAVHAGESKASAAARTARTSRPIKTLNMKKTKNRANSSRMVNRGALSTAPLFDDSDIKAYGLSVSPRERLRQVEILRRINYGHRATARLSRDLEITQRSQG